jgi:hypothetical protein
MYLQIVGRVLRPHPGKARAILIDLVGAMREHGFPTEDRYWDLMQGKPTRGEVAQYGMECPKCLAYFMRSATCPDCGYDFASAAEADGSAQQLVYNVELQCITTAAESRRRIYSTEEKETEWHRLAQICRDKNWSFSWAVKQYDEKFAERPVKDWLEVYDQIAELERLIAHALENRHHAYSVQKRYSDIYGEKPNWGLASPEKVEALKYSAARELLCRSAMSNPETVLQQKIRLEVQRQLGRGVRLFRNQVGEATIREPGKKSRHIKYGLGAGSPDLVGWRSIVITADMVGMTLAQFVGLEVKTATGSPTERQEAWLETGLKRSIIAAAALLSAAQSMMQ